MRPDPEPDLGNANVGINMRTAARLCQLAWPRFFHIIKESVMEKRTSIPANALIWFGAGVSLAEILTGTFFAPLGFREGGTAIIAGHVIGCFLLFLAGLIGARTRRSAMETVKMAFGARGGLLFAVLNVMQLVGWTSILNWPIGMRKLREGGREDCRWSGKQQLRRLTWLGTTTSR